VPWFLNSLVSSVAHRNGKKISALDNTFALIDEYIAADLSLDQTPPCSPAADHTFEGAPLDGKGGRVGGGFTTIGIDPNLSMPHNLNTP